jgi:hypothetical protein
MIARFALLLLPILQAAGPAATAEFDPKALWDDPEFRREFFGSYGIHPDASRRWAEERAALGDLSLFSANPDEGDPPAWGADDRRLHGLFDYLIGNLHFGRIASSPRRGARDRIAKFPRSGAR